MLELFSIAGRINMDGAEKADKQLDKLDQKGKGLGSKLGASAKKVGKAAAITGGALAGVGTAAFAMVTKVTGAFDDIAKTAPKLGVSTDALQEMDYWAGQNGISSQTMERGIGRLNQRMGRAAAGNEKYSEALKGVGVDMEGVKNGTISTEDAMGTAIQTLSGMSSEQEKSAAASELFGTKMARDLMPALQDGSLSLEDAKKKAEELGIVIGEDSLNSAEKFQDTWDNLTRTFTTVGQKLLAELMPAFQSMMDWVLDHMPQIQAVFSTVFGVAQNVFGAFITTIQTVIGWLSSWFESNSETMTGIKETIERVFGSVVEFLTQTWESIKILWQENGQFLLENAKENFMAIYETVKTVFESVWDTISTILQTIQILVKEYLTLILEFWNKNGQQLMDSSREIFDTVRGIVETVFQTINEIITGIMESLVPFIQKQLEKIQKFWDENGEAIMSVVDFAFSAIEKIIDEVMPVVVSIIENAWSIIESVFGGAIDVLLGLVSWFIDLFTGDFEGMKDSAEQIWRGLWDIVKGILEGAWGILSAPFAGLFGHIADWFVGLKDEAVEWGKNMIGGFIDGVKAMASKVTNAVSGVIDGAKDFLGFGSPTEKGEGRNIVKWGRNMVNGFTDGVEEEEKKIPQAVNNIVKKIQPEVNVGSRGVVQPRTENPSQTTTNNYADQFRGLLEGANFNVRNDKDIKEIARELGDYMNMTKRVRGQRG